MFLTFFHRIWYNKASFSFKKGRKNTKKLNKFVALLLAAVMVLGMMPTMAVLAHTHTHAAQLQGAEEYPVLSLDTLTRVDIDTYGKTAYFAFTPEVTDLYHFYSATVEGNNAFNQCGEMTEVTLPSTIETLGNNAFANCYSLKSIELPANVTVIPERCFSSCGSLENVIWNENLTAIGDNAFYGCGLGDTVLPEGITTLGKYAFGSCSMTKLTLPSTLTELATYALASMWNICNIIFTGDAPRHRCKRFQLRQRHCLVSPGQ